MALILSNCSVQLSPPFKLNENRRLRSHVYVRSVGREGSLTRKSVRISWASSVNKKGINVTSYDDGGKTSGEDVFEELEPLWDDGYGTRNIRDYVELVKDTIKDDGESLRWFCPVACDNPLKDSPALLYLPGIDGTGAGLAIHEQAIGKVFRVQCLHIPVLDRTPLEGLLKFVEEKVMIEHTSSPNKPIYLLGESFGGALALAVAARNPTIDLILVVANPATSFERSPVHPLSSLVGDLPEEYYELLPFVMTPLIGNFVKMAMVKNDAKNDLEFLWKLPGYFVRDIPLLSVLAEILPKETLQWKFKLLDSLAAYTNSRLHAITAQVLVLASDSDHLLPSKDEAQRLSRALKHCNVRVFKGNGHTILLESGVNVLSAIKTTNMYRHSSKHDIIKDFLPLNITEFKSLEEETWWYGLLSDPVMLSTMDDGKIVRGLAGIPDEGPVLVVGNHMLLAIDVFPVVTEFLREKKAVLHGLANPELFNLDDKNDRFVMFYTDVLKLIGAFPIFGRNLFKLLEKKSCILHYPGGAREALHRKGEAYELFWPDQQEFVRMAVKFGATIIPYGGVGEDDIFDLSIDYEEIQKIPFLNKIWDKFIQGKTNSREEMGEEIAEPLFPLPLCTPKIPGRLYFMFGKPIQTKGNEEMLDDDDYLQELYTQIKCEVEKNMAYLLKKREEDPYRGIVERLVWQKNNGTLDQIPSFEP